MKNTPTVFETLAETAAKIRATLKTTYPRQRFSVTCHRPGKVWVQWTDGPLASEVERLLERYEGQDFDPMQDLATPKHYPGDPNRYSGVRYLSCTRSLTPDLESRITERAALMYALPEFRDRHSPRQMEQAEMSLRRHAEYYL